MVPFLDLKAQYAEIKEEVNAAVLNVIESTQFILGTEVNAFEEEFAAYCGVDHCVALNSGTSALHMALLALDIGPGDEVVTVSSTFIATVASIRYVGATPVFVDVDPETWTMDPSLFEQAVTARTKAVIPVHLHGQVADMTNICEIADTHGIHVIEDAAQAHGAIHKGGRAGSFGVIGCFSFYPGKNLGAYGEGGAAVTRDACLERKMRVLRDWGQEEKHQHVVQGYNARMDGIQGAVLRVKLRHLDEWTERRRAHAMYYEELLANTPVGRPTISADDRHVFHVYSILVNNRDQVQSAFRDAGVGTNIHYPVPVHMQQAHVDLGYRAGDVPVSERLAAEFLSLPMYAELEAYQLETVIQELRRVLNV